MAGGDRAEARRRRRGDRPPARGRDLRPRPGLRPRRRAGRAASTRSATSASPRWSRSATRSRSVAPGDLVSVPFQISCGECDRCRRGQTGNCESVDFLSTYGLPLGPDNGGFVSDLARVPYAEAMLVAVPDGIEPARIASLSDNIPDAWRTVGPQLEAEPGPRC